MEFLVTMTTMLESLPLQRRRGLEPSNSHRIPVSPAGCRLEW